VTEIILTYLALYIKVCLYNVVTSYTRYARMVYIRGVRQIKMD